jgi:hypothetical protein
MGTGGLFSGAIVIMAYCCKCPHGIGALKDPQALDFTFRYAMK